MNQLPVVVENYEFNFLKREIMYYLNNHIYLRGSDISSDHWWKCNR